MANGMGSFTEFLFQTAEGNPESVALVDCDTLEEWTFNHLKDAVRSICSALARRGLRKGDVVATCAPNVLDHVAVTLAVPMIGGILTGINPLFTPTELLQHCESSGAQYLITTSSNLAKIGVVQRKYKGIKEVFVIGRASGHTSVRELMADDGQACPTVHIDPRQDVAILPYSSGTTGLPKGVMITHEAIIAQLALPSRSPELSVAHVGDTIIAMFPMFHISGLITLLVGICAGATTVIYATFNFERYLAAIEKYKATVLMMAPPVLLRLTKDPLVEKYNISSLRTISVSAAPTSESIQRAAASRLGVTDIRQGYGLTEATGPTHLSRSDEPMVPGSAGKATPIVTDKIIDVDTGVTLGPGQTGELCLKSPTVMKCYLNNPTATADIIDSNGWLHTGDIAYKDTHGNMFVVERLKELVKYKGFQVAPGELEAILLAHPDIADAGVVGIPDERAGEVPCAFVVLKTGHQQTAENLQTFINSQVAPYKRLRGGIYFLKAIPKTSSGKILRRLLRKVHVEGRYKDGPKLSKL